MSAKLIVAMVGEDGKPLSEHPLDRDALQIGRTTGNDIVLPDVEKRVSSKHARVERREGAWYVIDLGSTNGTFLNDRKIEAKQPVGIKDGDRITVGVFQLRFVVEEDFDQTIVHVDPARQAAKLADELCLAYAQRLKDPPEARHEALKGAMKSALAGVPKETVRAVCAQVRGRFETGAAVAQDRSTVVRKRDAEIQRQEELYQSGYKAIAALSSHFMGEGAFETSEQVEKFCTLMEQVLNITLQWLSSALKGRREFENQFSADLTMVFSKQGNPIKTAAAPTDIGKWLLDWRADRDTGKTKEQLEGAFKDLTMHQLGLLAGVQDAIKAALQRLDPKKIEEEASAAAKGLLAVFGQTKRAWELYTAKHKEMFEENSKLFNEVIYPSIRKGYLASHAAGGPEEPPAKPIAQI